MSVQQADELWQLKAACRGPQASVFFPPSHFERKDEKEMREAGAKAICATCSVREPCLEYALTNREHDGVWGGATEKERRRMIRQRRKSA